MMKYLFTILLITFGSLLFFSACEDDAEEIINTNAPGQQDQNSQPSPNLPPFDCSVFGYGDTIFYLQNQPQDYIVRPTDTTLDGSFGAFPEGLVLDTVSGAINVSQSETGLRYEVFFVPEGRADTCRTRLIISGIDYQSKVHRIDEGDTLAVPIYNGSQEALNPCEDDDDEDDDSDDPDDPDDPDDDDCEFDNDDSAADLGLAINPDNGAINLRQTMANGALGVNPINGDSLDFTINYQLNDLSNLAPNAITIRVFYYDEIANVPQDLLDAVETKRNSILRTQSRWSAKAARTTRTIRGRGQGRGRPPYIVIVGKAFR